MHEFLHVTGIDTQQSMFYDFWSGIATQMSVFFGAVIYYRKHNCHKKGCPFIGKHVINGTPYCSKHHTEVK